MSSDRPARPWDLLDPRVGRVTEAVRAERMAVCEACAHFRGWRHACAICNCVMELKTKLPHANCPLHFWGPAPSEAESV